MNETQTSGAPRRLNNAHLTMAVLAAAGKRPSAIARVLNYSLTRVSIIINSPLFQAEVSRIRDQFMQSASDDLLGKLRDEAIPTLDTLVGLRDGGNPEDNVRLGAAKELKNWLVDALPGMKHRADREDEGTLKVRIDVEALAPLIQAQAISEGNPVPTFAAEAIAGNSPDHPIAAITVDEAIDEYRSRENGRD